LKRHTDIEGQGIAILIWLSASNDKMISSRSPFHGLRHSHATLLASIGGNIKATQERLGHSTTRMTLDYYNHVTETMQDQAVSLLDTFYDAAKSSNSVSGQINGQTMIHQN
jgi:integrase